MAAPVPKLLLVTEAEYLELPETMERMELLDGEVILSPAPPPFHQTVLKDLLWALSDWERTHPPSTVLPAPVDVRFGPGRILQPDLLVVLDGLPRDAESPLTVIPDLVVEIMGGRNRSYDRIAKRAIYAEAGVKEYWVVDSQLARVEVFRGTDGAEVVTDTLRSALLPGFAVDVPTLLRS